MDTSSPFNPPTHLRNRRRATAVLDVSMFTTGGNGNGGAPNRTTKTDGADDDDEVGGGGGSPLSKLPPRNRRRSVRMLGFSNDDDDDDDTINTSKVDGGDEEFPGSPFSGQGASHSASQPSSPVVGHRKRASLGNAIEMMNAAVARRLERQRELLQAEEFLTDEQRRCRRLEEESLMYTRTVCSDGVKNKGFAELKSYHDEKSSKDVGAKMTYVKQGFQSRFGKWSEFVAPIRASESKLKTAAVGPSKRNPKLQDESDSGDENFGAGTLKPIILPKLKRTVMLTESAPFSFDKRQGRYVTEPTTVVIPGRVIKVDRPPAFHEAPLPRVAIRSERKEDRIDEDTIGLGKDEDDDTKIHSQKRKNNSKKETSSSSSLSNKPLKGLLSSKARKSLFSVSSDDHIARVPYKQSESHLIPRLRVKCPLEDNGCTKAANEKVIETHRHFRIPVARSIQNVTNRRLLMRQSAALVAENDARLKEREREMFHSTFSKHRFDAGAMGAFSSGGGGYQLDESSNNVFGAFEELSPIKKSVSHNKFKDLSKQRKSVAVSISLPDSWEDPTPVNPLQLRHLNEALLLKQEQEEKAQASRNRLVVSPRTHALIKARGPQHSALDVLEGLTDALESNLFWQLRK